MGVPDIDSILDQVANSESSQRLPFIEPGTYVLEVKEVTSFKGRKSNWGRAEFFVRESSPTGRDLKGNAVAPNPAGISVVSLNDFSKDMGPGNFKAILLAILGLPDFAETDLVAKGQFKEEAKVVVSKVQPARGILVRCDAVVIPKKDGDPFTKLNWSAHPDNGAEAVKTRRAAQEPAKAPTAA